MTAATTVDYSDTGPGNADLTEQDLPEELLFKEAYADTFKIAFSTKMVCAYADLLFFKNTDFDSCNKGIL
jgi:hypothetical protein